MYIDKALNIARVLRSSDLEGNQDKAGEIKPAFFSRLSDDQINDLFNLCDQNEIKESISQLKDGKQFKELVAITLLTKFAQEMQEADDFDRSLASATQDKQKERDAKEGRLNDPKTISYFRYIIDVVQKLGKAGSYDIGKLTVVDGLYIIDADSKDKKITRIGKIAGDLKEYDRFDYDDMIAESDLDSHAELDRLISWGNARLEKERSDNGK